MGAICRSNNWQRKLTQIQMFTLSICSTSMDTNSINSAVIHCEMEPNCYSHKISPASCICSLCTCCSKLNIHQSCCWHVYWEKPPKQWWEHMHYVAFSHCTSLQGPHIVDINETAISVSQKVKNYVSHEKKEMQLFYMPMYNMHNWIMLTYNDVGSLHHKWKAIQNNHNMQGSHVIFLAVTCLSPQ